MTSSGPEEVLRLGCEEAAQALRSISARKGRANGQDALYPLRHLAGQTVVGVNTWILAWQALALSLLSMAALDICFLLKAQC